MSVQSEFVDGKSNAWQRAWIASHLSTQRTYSNTVFGYMRCKADYENLESEDHARAHDLWMRYLIERVAQ